MVDVQLKTSLASPFGTGAEGDILSVPPGIAKSWIGAGLAEPVKEERPASGGKPKDEPKEPARGNDVDPAGGGKAVPARKPRRGR